MYSQEKGARCKKLDEINYQLDFLIIIRFTLRFSFYTFVNLILIMNNLVVFFTVLVRYSKLSLPL